MKRNINLEHFKYWLPSPDVTAAFSWRKNESCERFGEYWEHPAEKYWNYFYSEMDILIMKVLVWNCMGVIAMTLAAPHDRVVRTIRLRCNFLCVIIITPGVPSPHPPVPAFTSLVFPALQSPHGLLSFYIPTLHASRSIFYGWLCTEVKVIQKPIDHGLPT